MTITFKWSDGVVEKQQWPEHMRELAVAYVATRRIQADSARNGPKLIAWGME